jgi:hypothetical protein
VTEKIKEKCEGKIIEGNKITEFKEVELIKVALIKKKE